MNLAPVLFEILGGSKFMLGSPVPPVRPLAENFCALDEYFTMSNGVFNFNFLALVLSEILVVPNLHYGSLCPLDAPSGDIFVPKASTSQYLIVFLISTILL